MTKPERGLYELYADPERADYELWGRRPAGADRRGFLKGAGLAALEGFLRAGVPMARYMPAGLIPVPLSGSAQPFALPGKSGLIVLNDHPTSAECPAHLLDDAITPVDRLFVRNNGVPPADVPLEAGDWTVEIAGEACISPRTFSLRDLQAEFQAHTCQLQLECAGNGRSDFFPPAAGVQWTTGAIGCPRWTGVRVRDVLERCGVADNAVYVAFEGADRHVTNPDALPISRGVPMHKALEDESLLAWEINRQPLPELHGYPLRLVFGGWPGSASGKWVRRILIRDRVHDGAKMLGQSYRVPCEPVAPGEDVPDEQMCIIHSMPVKSLVTSPMSGFEHAIGEQVSLGGFACMNTSRVVELPCRWGVPPGCPGARLGRRCRRGRGAHLHRFRRDMAAHAPGTAGQPPGVATLVDPGALSRLRLLRNMGARGRCLRPLPAHDRARLESARVPEQCLPPNCSSCDLAACAVGIHGCKFALIRPFGRSISSNDVPQAGQPRACGLIRPFGRSISSNMARYFPQSIAQRGGDIEFSLSRLPTAQAASLASMT